MTLTILEILYIVLIIFASIIGTLLTIALIKIIKVLKVAEELTDFYNKIKQLFGVYSKIPEILKEKLSEQFVSKDEKKK